MIGMLLALASGFGFSVEQVFVRKGAHRSGESFSPVVISLFLGVIVFGILVVISGEVNEMASLSWLGVSSLTGAGILHFLIGRMAAYTSVRLIGANRAVPIHSSNLLFAALLGIIFLKESFGVPLLLAILLISGGIILIGARRAPRATETNISRGTLTKGVLAALTSAICWSVSPLLVKIGLNEVGSPLLGTFISYIAASIIMGILVSYPGNNQRLRRLERTSLIPFTIASIAVSVGQLCRYVALDYTQISIAIPLIGSARALFTFPLSFLFNRQIESFNLRTMIGAISIVMGIFLLML
ncbi:EamA family transporter [Chloroflexota bacterium]